MKCLQTDGWLDNRGDICDLSLWQPASTYIKNETTNMDGLYETQVKSEILHGWTVLDQCSHQTALMEDPQVTNLNSARWMVWRLKYSERWSHVQSTFCPSVLIDLLLSMWCLISAVADSSNSVNGQSTTDQHWKSQMDGVKVVKPLWVYKCSSLCARALIRSVTIYYYHITTSWLLQVYIILFM